MGTRIHGITIELRTEAVTGVDSFGVPVYEPDWVKVDNVLVGQPTDQEMIDAMNLYGERAVYVLGIPKGDRHNWSSGAIVRFFGESWRIFGHGIQGIDDLVPGPWNRKVMVASIGTCTDRD